MTRQLFTLEGPLCALEYGGGWQTAVCPICGRGRRSQIADLQFFLVCQSRQVWLSDGNAILLDRQLYSLLPRFVSKDLGYREVQATWRPDLQWANRPAPDLVQLVPRRMISASNQCVELDGCSCGSVRSISFKPLIVVEPGSDSSAWYLAQSTEVLVLHAALRDALMAAESDLEFKRVWREGEYSLPAPSLDPIDWSDL